MLAQKDARLLQKHPPDKVEKILTRRIHTDDAAGVDRLLLPGKTAGLLPLLPETEFLPNFADGQVLYDQLLLNSPRTGR